MEGIIKFNAKRISSDLISDNEFAILNPWRQQSYNAGNIGIGADGIGYGNISYRSGDDNEFIISASGTGGIKELNKSDYSRVSNFDISNNSLECCGNKLASSESLSHAAIYLANSNIKAVLHIHNIALWKKHLHKLPTTDKSAEYGTKAMADSISKLVEQNPSNNGIIVMGGHREGILSYGDDLLSCSSAVDSLLNQE